MTSLIVDNGAESFAFSEPFMIGRKNTALIVDDEYASSPHARFAADGASWYVEDYGSTNGTWLNGTRVYGPVLLTKGDKIRIGHTVLTVVPA